MRRLPDAEFELMKIIWQNKPPLTTNEIIERLDPNVSWKPQTVLTMLIRLIEKGFLKSQRMGRERNYSPLISQQEYMDIETVDFVSRYSGNSVGNLVKTMHEARNMSTEEIKELINWLKGCRM